MPTPRSPDSDRRSAERKEAERLYLESKGNMKLVEIAEKMKLPDSKIRKWKSLDRWEAKLHPDTKKKSKKKPVERSTSEKGSVPPKRGAPRENKNAVGHVSSTPKRNKNAEKHGAYSKVYWDALDDEELDLIDGMDDAEEQQLIMQLQMFSVRERRLMKAIKRYHEIEDENHGLSVKAASKTKKVEDVVSLDGESIAAGVFKKVTETSVTNTEAVMNSIMALESELTKVQRAKTKAIEALSKFRLEKAKIESENAGNAAVDDWIAAVLGEEVKDHE